MLEGDSRMGWQAEQEGCRGEWPWQEQQAAGGAAGAAASPCCDFAANESQHRRRRLAKPAQGKDLSIFRCY